MWDFSVYSYTFMRDFLQRSSCVYTSRGSITEDYVESNCSMTRKYRFNLSNYQKEMIETDSYLYTANNDRDDAGSDEHNSKHIHPRFTGNGKGLYATMRGGVSDF